MKKIACAFFVILMCLLLAGCHTGGIKFTQGEDETGECYITDGTYRYIRPMQDWYYVISRFDTYIGSVEDSNMKLYANAQDINRVLLEPKIFLHDNNLSLFVREDIIPDVLKDQVAYIHVTATSVKENGAIEYGNSEMIDDTEAIEQLNSLLFSQVTGIRASAYELIKEEGWREAYSISYSYAQTDLLFRESEILLSPENDYYLPALSGDYLKIADGRLKELIIEIAEEKPE